MGAWHMVQRPSLRWLSWMLFRPGL
uniref:Uncharacterized protein n=1 Tax=Anguilla anguilla TaxID=7936 RepID=A0A0E9VKP4_ANGAN